MRYRWLGLGVLWIWLQVQRLPVAVGMMSAQGMERGKSGGSGMAVSLREGWGSGMEELSVRAVIVEGMALSALG